MILTHLIAFAFLAGGTSGASGSGGGTLAGVSAAGTGVAPVHGTGAETLADAAASGSGTAPGGGATGSGGGTLAGASGSGAGAARAAGSGGGTLAGAMGTGAGVAAPVDQIIAIPERIVAITRVAAGPPGWQAAFDPSDRAPYAMDWTAMLEIGETIVDIVSLTMSASGASVGVQIDASTGRSPVIGPDGNMIQFWFLCDPLFQHDPAFLGAGVAVSISALIRTSATPFKEFERTAVLTVRQQ